MAVKDAMTGKLLTFDDGEYVEADYDENGMPSDEELAYAKFRAEMQDGDQYAKINVYRQPTQSSGRPGQRKLSFLFDCGLDEYEYSQLLAKLRDEYGSGTYRIQGRDAKGGMLFNRAISIEAPQKTDDRRERDPSHTFASFQRIMAEQQERTEALIERLTTRGAAGQTQAQNPLEMMAAMMGMVTNLMTVMNTGTAAKPTDALAEMKRFAEFQTIGKQLFGIDGDGGGNEKNIHDTISKTIETFGPMLMQGAAALQARAPQPQRRLPNPSPTPSASNAPNQPRPETMENKPAADPKLAAQVAVLLSNARAHVAPEVMAQSVLDMTPDDRLDALYAFVSDPEMLAKMAAVNPGVNEYREWFEAVAAYIFRELSEDDLHSENAGATLAPSSAPADEPGTDAATVEGDSQSDT